VGQVGRAQRDALIAQSRFTVLPSHAYETLGKTILESYGEGRGVVASDLGSRREFVHEGETGLLYRTGDVNQLATAIQTLSSRPELAEKMGRAGWEMVRQRHTPEEHYQKLLSLYEGLVARKAARNHGNVVAADIPRQFPQRNFTAQNPNPITLRQSPGLRVAFIGGRGVVSKYSGIETYYEEVGKQLALMGHEVTLYCRTYFTPAMAEYKGMRLVRLPTIRSKHLETVIHTLLSTTHALTQPYDLVHYHALGRRCFRFFRGCSEKRPPSPYRAWTGNERNGDVLRRLCCGWESELRRNFPMRRWLSRRLCNDVIARFTGLRRSICLMGEYCANEPSREGFWNGDSSRESTFCSWEDSRRRRVAICWSRPLSKSIRM